MQLSLLVKTKNIEPFESKAQELNLAFNSSPYTKKTFSLHIIELSTTTNQENDARALSRFISFLDDESDIAYLTLVDGPSTYYEEKLFKQFAYFERGLRAALYLRSSKENGDLDNDVISGIEQKDFGAVFEDLFVCEKFNTELKKAVNGGSKKLEKDAIIAEISNLSENTLWSQLFNDEEMPTVRAQHNSLRIWRNDVMHAHPMSFETFTQAHRTLLKANKEIEEYKKAVIGSGVKKPDGVNSVFQPYLLSSAAQEAVAQLATTYSNLTNQIDMSALMTASQAAQSIFKNLSEYQNAINGVSETMSQINTTLRMIDTSAIDRLAEITKDSYDRQAHKPMLLDSTTDNSDLISSTNPEGEITGDDDSEDNGNR